MNTAKYKIFHIWIRMGGNHFLNGYAEDEDGNQTNLITTDVRDGMEGYTYVFPETEQGHIANTIAWSPFAERLEILDYSVKEVTFHAKSIIWVQFGAIGKDVLMQKDDTLTIPINDERLEEIREYRRTRGFT